MYAAERRDLKKYPLPVALYIDEAHLFLTDYTPLFQATARSAQVSTVMCTQNLDSIRARFPHHTGNAEAENLLGNFNLKIFCAQDHFATNEWSAKLCGEVWQTRTNVNTSFGQDGNMGAGTTDQRRLLIDPIEFVKLRKGGPDNECKVDGIVFLSGRPFAATGTNHVRVSFPQNLG
jgi:type IV secretory pathway TraG/TraD family ATPase VirD4